jgi:hypothetical protein
MRLAASSQQLFEEPVYHDIEPFGDIVPPLGKLPFHIEDFLDPDVLLSCSGPTPLGLAHS